MELELVIFQYTLDAKQAAYSQAFHNCIQDLQNNLTKLLKLNDQSDLSTIFTQLSLDKMVFLNQFGFKLTGECLI